MQDKIQTFKAHVREISARPSFAHHQWFAQYHLEIVERLSKELLTYHPQADPDLVEIMAWLHDYGKIIDFDHQHERRYLNQGRDKLIELGFENSFASKAADNIELQDNYLEMDLHAAPIEVQIVSSADGCSHLIGPFMMLYWYEHADQPYKDLMTSNSMKARKDWKYKIVLPEARSAFQARHDFLLEQAGRLTSNFFK